MRRALYVLLAVMLLTGLAVIVGYLHHDDPNLLVFTILARETATRTVIVVGSVLARVMSRKVFTLLMLPLLPWIWKRHVEQSGELLIARARALFAALRKRWDGLPKYARVTVIIMACTSTGAATYYTEYGILLINFIPVSWRFEALMVAWAWFKYRTSLIVMRVLISTGLYRVGGWLWPYMPAYFRTSTGTRAKRLMRRVIRAQIARRKEWARYQHEQSKGSHLGEIPHRGWN